MLQDKDGSPTGDGSPLGTSRCIGPQGLFVLICAGQKCKGMRVQLRVREQIQCGLQMTKAEAFA